MIKSRAHSGLSVRDLQQRAQLAATPARPPAKRLSRSARLHLIDMLSRWSGGALALIAGLTISIAVITGGAYPARTGVWLAMVIIALAASRHMRGQFRGGEKIAARPFRWRANYTASLCVISAAFGAGVFLTGPAPHLTEAAPSFVLLLSAFLMAGLFVAAGFHVAHGRSIAALIGPGASFITLGLGIANGAATAIAALAVITSLTGGLMFVSRKVQQRIGARFPRTRYVRRGKEDPYALSHPQTNPRSSALSA